ncbi:protein NRT1/ PTR FAMILY 1.2-like [Vicia villosa]|uniref:protein NRT1/ PTR FAMILY 1.2-like n=1 Tax=Vicia villosa TaxID=3911 RepID=UPI00273B17C6|nr:protein NRT1/ PTR FAMILY 1.2-like [Vicia villosa]
MNKEVELCSVDADEISQQSQRCKGGLITMPFIIANEAFSSMASLGLLPNMIVYWMGSYRLHLGKATQILLLSSAANNFTSVVGAFLVDSYLGRFLGVGLGSAATFLGMTLLWLTTMVPQARPPACVNPTEGCKSATKGQMATLLSVFGLMSIGKGALSCSLAFGADQVNRKDNPNNHRVLEIFFSGYYAFTVIGIIIGLVGIVYIQDHLGWKIGFGIPATLMLLSTLLFFLASPLYVKITKRTGLFTSFAQVTVATYKNRKLPLPPNNSTRLYHHKKNSTHLKMYAMWLAPQLCLGGMAEAFQWYRPK